MDGPVPGGWKTVPVVYGPVPEGFQSTCGPVPGGVLVVCLVFYLKVGRLSWWMVLFPMEDHRDFALVVHDLPGGDLLLQPQC